jgi:hypothetical protein
MSTQDHYTLRNFLLPSLFFPYFRRVCVLPCPLHPAIYSLQEANMNSGSPALNVAQNTLDEYKELSDFCRTYNYAISTTHRYIRNGDIALHQFPGEPRPKLNVAEALMVLSKVKRKYTNPLLRIIRHDDSESPKVDLFG